MTEGREDDLPLGPQVPYYAFYFPNIFDTTLNLPIPESVSESEAKAICKRLFRMDELPKDQVQSPVHTSQADPKDPVQSPADSAYINTFILARLSTLGPVTSRTDFLALCLGMLVWLMEKMLQLKVTLLWTTGEREIVCLIGASDRAYARMAHIQKLRFRLDVKPDTEDAFKKVSPSTLLCRAPHPKSDLKHYTEDNIDGVEAASSIFSQLSRLSLLINHFDNVICFHAWVNMGLISTHFALHDRKALESLYAKWKLTELTDGNLIKEIRRYFGELIALYFAWLGHLQLWLLAPAVIGTGVWLLSMLNPQSHISLYEKLIHITFTAFIVVWATLQGKFWLRREKDFSWRWALYQNSLKETDYMFDSESREWDPATARMRKPRYEDKRTAKLAVGFAVTVLWAALSLLAQAGIYSLDLWVQVGEREYDLSGLVIGVQICVFTKIYDIIGVLFTLWEDYGTTAEFVEAMCSKFFLLRVLICYSPVMYVAFVKVRASQAYQGKCYESNCLLELNWLLLSLFALQFVFKLAEIVWLFLSHFLRQQHKLQELGPNAPSYEQDKYLNAQVLSFSTYCDLIMNYGYAALFAAGCPVIVLLVLLLTAVQARLDVWRLVRLSRRFGPKTFSSWAGANNFINLLAVLGTMTNPGIIIFSSPYFSDSGEWKLFIFVAIEHCHFLLKILLENTISDEAESKLYSVVRMGKQWCDLKEMELCARLSKPATSPTRKDYDLPTLDPSDKGNF